MIKSRYIGDGRPPTLIGNPYNGYINPYYWVDDFILYYMEIMGVDRPDRTYNNWDGKVVSGSLADRELAGCR